MRELILYTTSYCHLCEQAEAILLELNNVQALNWLAVEITTDDALVEQYGMSIPVIKKFNNNSELNWPFTKQDVIEFLLQD